MARIGYVAPVATRSRCPGASTGFQHQREGDESCDRQGRLLDPYRSAQSYLITRVDPLNGSRKDSVAYPFHERVARLTFLRRRVAILLPLAG